MHPLTLLTYTVSSIFAAYMIAVGATLLLNSPHTAMLLGVLVNAKHKQRIRRELPRLNKTRRIITGAGWLFVGLFLGGSIILNGVIHRR